MRPDILPSELTDELSLLQDQVPSLAFSQARIIAEAELGTALSNIFISFEPEPIASASIGQVHRAYLKDGTAVAVKIQRPNLAQTIYQDLGFIKLVAKLGKFLYLKGDWQGLLDLVDEFGLSLFAEMDYLQEGRNADRLRKNLRSIPAIIIPRIFWRYTTRKILTEELCQGIKIDNCTGLALQQIDIKRLCTFLINAYLEQVFTHGYFHADPHAGNFAVTNTGQIIIYDFGMFSYLTSTQRHGLIEAITSIVNNDSSDFLTAMQSLGIIANVSDAHRIKLQQAMQLFLTYCQTASAAEINVSELEKQVDALIKKQSLKLPANLAYLIRTVSSLDGLIRQLNEDFNFVRAAKPYFKPEIIKKLAVLSSVHNFNNN